MGKFEYSLLCEELKKVLKGCRVRYAQLAETLGMSESSVKRVLNKEDGSLGRLEQICDFLGIKFFDLVSQAHQAGDQEFVLTPEQSQFFMKNPEYMSFFTLLYEEGLSVKEIAKEHRLNRASVVRYLNQLEKLGLLEVHAGDRVRFLVQGGFTVDPHDPIAQMLENTMLENLTHKVKERHSAKIGKRARLFMRIGELKLSPESRRDFEKELLEVYLRFDRVGEREKKFLGPTELATYTYTSVLSMGRLSLVPLKNLV